MKIPPVWQGHGNYLKNSGFLPFLPQDMLFVRGGVAGRVAMPDKIRLATRDWPPLRPGFPA
ncbi:hypothetical protein CFR76_11045 [Komagataeibacter swingsii]|uniref:Uncharacterized protein n=1 Tax=Komagataeibacter swingsii TaxID=215220 RepID=A0A2V4RKG8_9PROT|nr:hypothetical protein CFR76_11045 [Komagataeibacter swingsii]GBQ58595.1 hypothetical protein AA16373_1310 [Komagataeibacter swingsii DSM 16373]